MEREKLERDSEIKKEENVGMREGGSELGTLLQVGGNFHRRGLYIV